MKRFLSFLFVISCFYSIAQGLNEESIIITYIGNMGVLISNSSNSVLIDALHKKYKPAYVFPDPEEVDKIIKGTYKKLPAIDIILATHHHKDHFDASYVKTMLAINQEVIFIGSEQMCNNLINTSQKENTQIWKTPYNGKLNTYEKGDLEIKSFKCPHVNPSRHGKVQNTAYIVGLCGVNILHIGDTSWEMAGPEFTKHQISTLKIDIVVLPYWMLLDKNSVKKLNKLINPKQIVATHIPPDFTEVQKTNLMNTTSKLIVLDKKGQRFTYRK